MTDPAGEGQGEGERMPPADADNTAARGAVDVSVPAPQPGVDVPDRRRGRTGLDRIGVDMVDAKTIMQLLWAALRGPFAAVR